MRARLGGTDKAAVGTTDGVGEGSADGRTEGVGLLPGDGAAEGTNDGTFVGVRDGAGEHERHPTMRFIFSRSSSTLLLVLDKSFFRPETCASM